MSQTVKIGEKIVRRTQIIGTNFIVFNAYEPSSPTGNHSTITTIDGEWYGEIPTRRLTPELEALAAMSDERYNAVTAYHYRLYDEAYDLILQAFADAAGGQQRGGEITLSL